MKPTLALAIVIAPAIAHAEGELGPMFGGSVLASHNADVDVAGVGAELVFWYKRFGLGVEASRQWSVDTNGADVGTVSGSLRVLAFDRIVPSLLDSDEVVDLGIELHGIVERSWWADTMTTSDPMRYGLGLAVRLRGVNDEDRSNLLSESRVFVRVMKGRSSQTDIIARDTDPSSSSNDMGVMIGFGAAFGGGQSGYVQQLRRDNALDYEWLVP